MTLAKQDLTDRQPDSERGQSSRPKDPGKTERSSKPTSTSVPIESSDTKREEYPLKLGI